MTNGSLGAATEIRETEGRELDIRVALPDPMCHTKRMEGVEGEEEVEAVEERAVAEDGATKKEEEVNDLINLVSPIRAGVRAEAVIILPGGLDGAPIPLLMRRFIILAYQFNVICWCFFAKSISIELEYLISSLFSIDCLTPSVQLRSMHRVFYAFIKIGMKETQSVKLKTSNEVERRPNTARPKCPFFALIYLEWKNMDYVNTTSF